MRKIIGFFNQTNQLQNLRNIFGYFLVSSPDNFHGKRNIFCHSFARKKLKILENHSHAPPKMRKFLAIQKITPSLGFSFPNSNLSKVDFPAPEAPAIETNSFGSIFKLIFSTAAQSSPFIL